VTNQTSTCRLCETVAPLVRSHTIPQALHKDVQKYEETGQFSKMFSDKFNYQPESRTGVWDRMVCDSCEKKFQDWDDYGVNFVREHRSAEQGLVLGEGGKSIALVVQKPNYKKLKLFVLSMLWRADANTQSFFDRIDLGKKWRARLTDLILRSDPAKPEEFSVAASLFRSEEERYFMADPHRERYDNVNHVRFYIYGGFTFLIKVDKRSSPEPFNRVILRPQNEFFILMRNLSPSEKGVLDKVLRTAPGR
jgi:hypothetical protein